MKGNDNDNENDNNNSFYEADLTFFPVPPLFVCALGSPAWNDALNWRERLRLRRSSFRSVSDTRGTEENESGETEREERERVWEASPSPWSAWPESL